MPCIQITPLWKQTHGAFLYYQNGHITHYLLQDVKIVSGCYLSAFWVTPDCPIFSDSDSNTAIKSRRSDMFVFKLQDFWDIKRTAVY